MEEQIADLESQKRVLEANRILLESARQDATAAKAQLNAQYLYALRFKEMDSIREKLLGCFDPYTLLNKINEAIENCKAKIAQIEAQIEELKKRLEDQNNPDTPGQQDIPDQTTSRTPSRTTVTHVHDYAVVKKIEPTCDKGGSITEKCSSCGTTSYQTLPKLGHSFTESYLYPDGPYDVYKLTCTRCSYSKTEYRQKGKQSSTKSPTSTQTQKPTTAPTPKPTQASRTAQPLHTHRFDIITEEIVSTCVKSGSRTRKCSVCGALKLETIPTIAHQFGSWITTENGRYKTCRICGAVQSEFTGSSGTSHTGLSGKF